MPRSTPRISVTDAAESLGLAPSTVRSYCRDGLNGRQIGKFDATVRRYFLTPSDVKFIGRPQNRPAIGRPSAE